jgi:hypothetical protein
MRNTSCDSGTPETLQVDLTRTNSRLELLRARERQIREKVAAEQVRLAKSQKRDAAKEEALIGAAVVRAATQSSQFKRAVMQEALAQITDSKQRAFLAGRGWRE